MARSVFVADYEVSGPRLDVDRLLETVVRRARSAVWRVGDATEFGPELTSGLRLPVYRGNFQVQLERAITTFVQREAALLRAVRPLVGLVRGWDTQASLTTVVFVGSNSSSVGVALPVPLLEAAAHSGLDLAVVAFAAGDGKVKGKTPSNKRMQLTRSAMAHGRRGPRS
jgi:hypothetical protein